MAEKETAAYIPPFDHPDIWEGNSTLIEEAAQQLDGNPPGAVICVVGGGGLLSGVALGMQKVGWNDVPILTAETEGASSYYSSIKAGWLPPPPQTIAPLSNFPLKGEIVTLPSITSVAKSLGAVRVCEESFLWSKKRPIIPCTVTDKQAVDAALRFADDHHFLVRPPQYPGLNSSIKKVEVSCAAGLAAVYEQKKELLDLKPRSVLVVVCGGSMCTIRFLQDLQRQLSGLNK